MSNPKHSHACFLPANYRQLLKQYEADCERGVEGQAVSGESEIDRQAAQRRDLTDSELAGIQRSLKELTEWAKWGQLQFSRLTSRSFSPQMGSVLNSPPRQRQHSLI